FASPRNLKTSDLTTPAPTMRFVLLAFFLAVFHVPATAQTAPADTTIHELTDLQQLSYPLMRSCQPERHPGWTTDSIRRCAESQLLILLARNIRYPEVARQNNTEGTVVVSFVVEPDGRMQRFQLLKDIGLGCGEESIRVMKALDEAGLRWQPGLIQGKPVRTRQVLPIRFRLQEALPYYLSEQGDTIYTVIETAPAFRGGMDSLTNFLVNKLEYPSEYADSCKTGIIEMALLIRNDGTVQVDNELDFNNLGFEFQFKALRLALQTQGDWQPAQYAGKSVTSTLPLRVLFKSDAPRCATANATFDRTMLLADAAAGLFEENKTEEAVRKWSEALALEPNNTELLYYRGSALLNLNKRDEACLDFSRIKSVLGVTWFEPMRRIACGW
ncbi:MAG: energy transducer TonB, partial [Saprospiraceae bacterium]